MFVLVLILGGFDGCGYIIFYEKKIFVFLSMCLISFIRDKGCYDNFKLFNIFLNDV